MLYVYKRDLSWLENFLDNLKEGFFTLDIIVQYAILLIIVYILVLGSIEFIKKVLIYIPRKIIGIIVIFLRVHYNKNYYFCRRNNI